MQFKLFFKLTMKEGKDYGLLGHSPHQVWKRYNNQGGFLGVRLDI